MKTDKRNFFLKTAFTFIFLFFYFASPAQSGIDLIFSDWDEDGNGIITRTEFVDLFTSIYVDDWNLVDDRNHLDDEDFYNATFNLWDIDNDGRLSEEEWMFGRQHSYGEYVFESIEAVDLNGDGFLQPTEYYDVLDETNYYPDWNVDESDEISELELARMVFNTWDSDDSKFIEQDEYEEFDEQFSEF